MKFKKIFSVVVLCIMLISLCSCSVGSGPSGIEKEILAGHSWGETENQFNSVPAPKTLFGEEVYLYDAYFAPNLYEIYYYLHSDDMSDYDRISNKLKSYCNTYEEEEADSEFDHFIKRIEGYKDSIKFVLSIKEDNFSDSEYRIYLHMSNDKEYNEYYL